MLHQLFLNAWRVFFIAEGFIIVVIFRNQASGEAFRNFLKRSVLGNDMFLAVINVHAERETLELVIKGIDGEILMGSGDLKYNEFGFRRFMQMVNCSCSASVYIDYRDDLLDKSPVWLRDRSTKIAMAFKLQ